jgi:hypothetical protein
MEGQIEEITIRLANIIGKIAYSIRPYDFHIKYKSQFSSFFLSCCSHKEIEMRRAASYNLPCFNFLYSSFSEELSIDF